MIDPVIILGIVCLLVGVYLSIRAWFRVRSEEAMALYEIERAQRPANAKVDEFRLARTQAQIHKAVLSDNRDEVLRGVDALAVQLEKSGRFKSDKYWPNGGITYRPPPRDLHKGHK